MWQRSLWRDGPGRGVAALLSSRLPARVRPPTAGGGGGRVGCSDQGRLLALRRAVAAGLAPPVLVFVASKERAATLARRPSPPPPYPHPPPPPLARPQVFPGARRAKHQCTAAAEL